MVIIELVFLGCVFLILMIKLGKVVYRHKKVKRETFQKNNTFYTLPDRENTFIRSRLNTVLRENLQETYHTAIPLEYTITMIEKLKSAPLTFFEKNQIREIEQAVKESNQKLTLKSEEVRSLNETLCALLKISAKYFTE